MVLCMCRKDCDVYLAVLLLVVVIGWVAVA